MACNKFSQINQFSWQSQESQFDTNTSDFVRQESGRLQPRNQE